MRFYGAPRTVCYGYSVNNHMKMFSSFCLKEYKRGFKRKHFQVKKELKGDDASYYLELKNLDSFSYYPCTHSSLKMEVMGFLHGLHMKFLSCGRCISLSLAQESKGKHTNYNALLASMYQTIWPNVCCTWSVAFAKRSALLV